MRTRYRIEIEFRESETPFQPANHPTDWIDTSYSKDERAIGDLRWPAVDNGRYEDKHPILNAQGNTVGFLVNGVGLLGYTFDCVYAADCFWITHQGFSAVINAVDISQVSIVKATGIFLLSPGNAKFEVVNSFQFRSSWVDTVRAFKLLDNGAYLLYLTNYGVCLFDTRKRDIVSRADFTNFAYQWSGFALSPRKKLLAIACSISADEDRLDDTSQHRNFVQIYNLESSELVGENDLPGDEETEWTVDFSEDGRQLRVASQSSTHTFDLISRK